MEQVGDLGEGDTADKLTDSEPKRGKKVDGIMRDYRQITYQLNT